jgi:adenylate cyclase
MIDRFARKHPLLFIIVVALTAQAIGSSFNIWYNLTTINPLISQTNQQSLVQTIIRFNMVVYPVALSCWVLIINQLRTPVRRLLDGQPVDADSLQRYRRQAINLPWWLISIAAVAWFSTIPIVLRPLVTSAETIDVRVPIHFAVSISVSAMIALSHAFFAIEMASHRYLFPVLFGSDKSAPVQPSSITGAYPLTLRGRGLAWLISAVFCPIVSMLLLFYVADEDPVSSAPRVRQMAFPIAVGSLGILFGFISMLLMGQLYGEPIGQLLKAAKRVDIGDLDARVDLLRGDEFGPLIQEFNEMTAGLKEKESIRNMFGLHVGRQAAAQIMASDPGLGGSVREVTVMFVDIRGFTSRGQIQQPTEVVAILNEFFTEMVDIVEREFGGMVNKFLGDGFMALFGASGRNTCHADHGVEAGAAMLVRLKAMNRSFQARKIEPLEIGIGIHTGPALIGSIGSEQRLEFTAIGDTVNIASRVESLTKTVGVPLLLTAATREQLQNDWPLTPQEPQSVKGVAKPVVTFSVLVNGNGG